MLKTLMHAALLVGCLAALVPPVPAASDQVDQAQSELKALRDRMKALQQHLATTRRQQDSVRHELAQAELAISSSTRQLDELRDDLTGGRQRLDRLRDRLAVLRSGIADQQRILGDMLYSTYVAGQQDTLKLLLNQEDPAALGRMLTYHQYFARARAAQIDSLRQDVAELQQLNRDIRKQVTQLEGLETRLDGQRKDLLAHKQRRQVLLDQLASEIESGDGRLKRMQADEARLGQLIEDLRQIIEDVTPPPTSSKDFAQMRGQLAWPNPGPILHGFGSPRNLGNLKWQGVLIGAKPGESVRAVHYGRVAFADWLRGFGLLLIIDHGGGFMTLYGYNEQLLKQTGDWVTAGEILARSGSSGGQDETGVFFSIRRNGKPIDPQRWCAVAAPPSG